MSIINGMNAAGMGMTAQAERLSAISSNIANINTVAGSPDDAFKAQLVNFKTVKVGDAQGVKVTETLESTAANRAIFAPFNPLADEKGYVYASNVDQVEMSADMISAEQSYTTNAKMAKALKDIALTTINAVKD